MLLMARIGQDADQVFVPPYAAAILGRRRPASAGTAWILHPFLLRHSPLDPDDVLPVIAEVVDIGDLVALPSHLVKPDIPFRANTQISVLLAEAARVCLEYVQVRVRPVERRLEDVMQSGELNVAWDFKPTPDGWLRPPDVDPEPENRPGPGPPRDSSVPRLGLLRFGQRA